MEYEKISFNEIKSLFDPKYWDVGVLTKEGLLRASLAPVKYKFHVTGFDFTNDINFVGLTNTIILIRTGSTWDYTHYDESVSILQKSRFKDWFQVYTNFKEAAILAGLGVRARNSLVYSYKFGFDCHIAAIAFQNEIIDLPTNKRINHKLWSRCRSCYDCVDACPVNAIRAREEPYWLNSTDCDNFIGLSDHPTIPSIKKFWHENVYPELPKEEVEKMKTFADVTEKFGGQGFPWDRNGYSFDGNVVRKDGEVVNIAFCRECTSQPRCSKWGGKYPYDEMLQTKKQFSDSPHTEYKPIKFIAKSTK